MRDIRNDLQERADFCQDQMRGVCAQFEKMVQQLHSERDARLAGLKSTLAAIEKLIEYERGTWATWFLSRTQHRLPRVTHRLNQHRLPKRQHHPNRLSTG